MGTLTRSGPMVYVDVPSGDPRDPRVRRFGNGYGASVVLDPATGLFDLVVLRWDGRDHCEIVYDTPVTNDHVPNLTAGQVDELLGRIRHLPTRDEGCLDSEWLARGVGIEWTPDGVHTAISRRNRDRLLPAIEARGRAWSLPAQRPGGVS